MYKKVFSVILCVALLFSIPFCVSAVSPDNGLVVISQTDTEVDGGVITKTIWASPVMTRSSGSKPAKATIEFKSSSRVEWTYTIGGYFSWNGVSATASQAWDDYTVTPGWKCTRHAVSASGPSIQGSAAFQYLGGGTHVLDPNLVCSPDGVFS